MMNTSYWERGKLAFIGTWYEKVSKADIWVHLKTVYAAYVCATLIHGEGNRASLRAAGFEPVAYGRRNGVSGSIQLWLAKNPFYPKRIAGLSNQRFGDFHSFSCGVRCEFDTPKSGFLWVGRKKVSGARPLCPGWYVTGKKGHAFLYL